MHHSEQHFLLGILTCSFVHHHINIFNSLAISVRKTCLWIPHTYCNALNTHLDDANNDYIRVLRPFMKQTRAL